MVPLAPHRRTASARASSCVMSLMPAKLSHDSAAPDHRGPEPEGYLSARATAVFSDASAFFCAFCCLLRFWVFSATAGFCCGCSALSTFSSHAKTARSEEHTSELQSQSNLVCRLLLEKKK